MSSDKAIKVVCAIVEQKERVLLTQRSERMREALLWEFPGGKLEAGETETGCLVREIKEELHIEVQPYERLNPVLHRYPDLLIELIPYRCHYTGGTVVLQEHRSYQWVPPQDLQRYTWCPADIPVVEEYLQQVKGRP